MDKRFSEEAKSKLTKELAADLPLMRAKLGLSQEELGGENRDYQTNHCRV